MAQLTPGGAIFGKSDIPSLRDQWMQDTQNERLDRKEAVKQAEIQRKQNTNNNNVLNRLWDPSKIGTGDPRSEEIRAFLVGKRDEYAKWLREGGMSVDQIMSFMNDDLSSVNEYLSQSKNFNNSIKNTYRDLEKEGINIYGKGGLDELLREKMFFSTDENGKLVPKSFHDIDWRAGDALEKALKDERLSLDQSISLSDLVNRPLSTEGADIYQANTPNIGWALKTREKGSVSYDPIFHKIDKDRSGVITGMGLNSRQYTTPDGQTYIDRETGQPGEVIAEPAFDLVYTNGRRGRKALIDRAVNAKVKELSKKGIEVNDDDIEYLKRKEATAIVEHNVKSRVTNSNSEIRSFRRPPRPNGSSQRILDEFDIKNAEQSEDGGYVVTGGTGYINLKKDERGRDIKTLKNVVYPDGSIRLFYRNKNKYGIEDGDVQDVTYSPEEALRRLEGLKGLPGNKTVVPKVIKAIKSVKQGVDQTVTNKKDTPPISQPSSPFAPGIQTKFKGSNKKMY